MMMYLNTHAALEQLRLRAEKDSARGPICMLVSGEILTVIGIAECNSCSGWAYRCRKIHCVPTVAELCSQTGQKTYLC